MHASGGLEQHLATIAPFQDITPAAGRQHISRCRLLPPPSARPRHFPHPCRQSYMPNLPAVREQEDGRAAGSDSSGDDLDADLLQHFSGSAGPGPNRRAGSGGGVRRNRSGGKRDEELLLLDPKRAKRILANRMSAARWGTAEGCAVPCCAICGMLLHVLYWLLCCAGYLCCAARRRCSCCLVRQLSRAYASASTPQRTAHHHTAKPCPRRPGQSLTWPPTPWPTGPR